MSDRSYRMLVGGAFESGATLFDVINPATGEAFARCPKADVDLLNGRSRRQRLRSDHGRPVLSLNVRRWSGSSPISSRPAPVNSPRC